MPGAQKLKLDSDPQTPPLSILAVPPNVSESFFFSQKKFNCRNCRTILNVTDLPALLWDTLLNFRHEEVPSMGVVRVNGRCGSFVVQWKVNEPSIRKNVCSTWCLQMHAGVGCMCPMINCGAGCVRTVCFVLFMENDTRLPLPLAHWATRSPRKSRAAQWILSSTCLAALASLRHGTAVALWLWRSSRTRCGTRICSHVPVCSPRPYIVAPSCQQ